MQSPSEIPRKNVSEITLKKQYSANATSIAANSTTSANLNAIQRIAAIKPWPLTNNPSPWPSPTKLSTIDQCSFDQHDRYTSNETRFAFAAIKTLLG